MVYTAKCEDNWKRTAPKVLTLRGWPRATQNPISTTPSWFTSIFWLRSSDGFLFIYINSPFYFTLQLIPEYLQILCYWCYNFFLPNNSVLQISQSLRILLHFDDGFFPSVLFHPQTIPNWYRCWIQSLSLLMLIAQSLLWSFGFLSLFLNLF